MDDERYTCSPEDSPMKPKPPVTKMCGISSFKYRRLVRNQNSGKLLQMKTKVIVNEGTAVLGPVVVLASTSLPVPGRASWFQIVLEAAAEVLAPRGGCARIPVPCLLQLPWRLPFTQPNSPIHTITSGNLPPRTYIYIHTRNTIRVSFCPCDSSLQRTAVRCEVRVCPVSGSPLCA